MSLVGNMVKGGTILICFAGIGWGIAARSQAINSYRANTEQLADLKTQYRRVSRIRPTKKVVMTNYQKALNTGKAYLQASNDLHQVGNMRDAKARKAFSKMESLYDGNVTGPMVDFPIKDWHGEVSYGGQTPDGKVLVSFKFLNNQNQVMKIVTCYYHPDTNKLSGMTSYMSNAGAQATRSALRDSEAK